MTDPKGWLNGLKTIAAICVLVPILILGACGSKSDKDVVTAKSIKPNTQRICPIQLGSMRIGDTVDMSKEVISLGGVTFKKKERLGRKGWDGVIREEPVYISLYTFDKSWTSSSPDHTWINIYSIENGAIKYNLYYEGEREGEFKRQGIMIINDRNKVFKICYAKCSIDAAVADGMISKLTELAGKENCHHINADKKWDTSKLKYVYGPEWNIIECSNVVWMIMKLRPDEIIGTVNIADTADIYVYERSGVERFIKADKDMTNRKETEKDAAVRADEESKKSKKNEGIRKGRDLIK